LFAKILEFNWKSFTPPWYPTAAFNEGKQLEPIR